MNIFSKRGFFGMIALLIIAVVIGGSLFAYYQVKKNGVQISSGNLQVDIQFNGTKPPEIPTITNQDNYTQNNTPQEDIEIQIPSNNSQDQNNVSNSSEIIIEELN